MSRGDRQQDTDKLTLFIWGGTIFVAAAIVGACVFIAIHNRMPPAAVPQPETIIAQTAPQAETAPAPTVKTEPEKPSAPIKEAAPAPEPAPAPDLGPAKLQLDNLAGTLKLAVPFLAVRNKMPLDHTCYLKNISPAMTWSDAPSATKSYAVFLEKREQGKDPFVSWILFNIPASEAGLAAALPHDDELPNGARHATSDHNNTGYIGPCDPKGKFVYALRVFALDTVLAVPARTNKNDLIRAMNGHIIDAAEQQFIHYKTL